MVATLIHPFFGLAVPRVAGAAGVAAGSLNLAQERLRTTLADVGAWRTFCGVSTQAAALDRIHHQALPKPADGEQYTLLELQGYLPYAIVWTDDSDGFALQQDASGSSHWFQGSGRLQLMIVREVPTALADDEAAADFDMQNQVGQIVDGLGALAGTPDYLAISRMRVSVTCQRNDKEAEPTEGQQQACLIEIVWGGEM